MQKSQKKRDILMELTPQILIVVLPLIFLGGFVDSVAGGGGLITLPAYLMAGIPAHLAMGTNKVVNGIGTATASVKYFRGGKIKMRPAIIAGVGALVGAAIGTRIALLIPENILKIMMLVALPCAAILLILKRTLARRATRRNVSTPSSRSSCVPRSSAWALAATTGSSAPARAHL